MSFTDQKQQPATAEHLTCPWGGRRDGSRFRCYLCGHRFKVGDLWRWVMDNDGKSRGGCGNFMVCASCDGSDVRERWWAHCSVGLERYWWLRQEG